MEGVHNFLSLFSVTSVITVIGGLGINIVFRISWFQFCLLSFLGSNIAISNEWSWVLNLHRPNFYLYRLPLQIPWKKTLNVIGRVITPSILS